MPDHVHLNSGSAAAARGETDGCFEPPVTPVGRDDLELRRHRFFNELLKAAQATREHRVRFNPLGPEIAQLGGDGEQECANESYRMNIRRYWSIMNINGRDCLVRVLFERTIRRVEMF